MNFIPPIKLLIIYIDILLLLQGLKFSISEICYKSINHIISVMRRLISDLYLRIACPPIFYSISLGGDRKLKYDKVAVISSRNRIDPLTVALE